VKAVSEQGSVERVPLKVVPYYVHPEAPQVEPGPPPEDPAPPVARRAFPYLGSTALGLAVLTAAAHTVAVVVASGGDARLGTILGYLAIGLSIIAVASGIASMFVDRVRWPGIAGIALGLVANPFLVLLALRWVQQAAS
jgi:hypothetical protein